MAEAQSLEVGDRDSGGQQKRGRKAWIWVMGIVAGLILVSAGFLAMMAAQMDSTPPELDTSSTRTSENGLYSLSYQSDSGAFPINKIHTWTLHVETADGEPVEDARITVDGGMPQHGHGLPTQPKVTKYLGNGDYAVEGMKFQMTGWWEVKFNVVAEDQQDDVTFNLVLK